MGWHGPKGACGCCGCVSCCADGIPSQIDMTIPAGFTAGVCGHVTLGCYSLAGVYTLGNYPVGGGTIGSCDSPTTYTFTPSSDPEDCLYRYSAPIGSPTVCNPPAFPFAAPFLVLVAKLIRSEAGCYWRAMIRLEGGTTPCHTWIYETTPEDSWSDCGTRIWTPGLVHNSQLGYGGDLCATPPATIDLEAS